MRTAAIAAILGTIVVVGSAATSTPPDNNRRAGDSLERSFVSKGNIRMDLSAGEYRISGAPDNRIRVDWSVSDPDYLWKVKAKADVRGTDATIATDGPSNKGFRVTIHVPSESNLYVRLTAGEMKVAGIRGNKDIELHAGELDIDVGRADDYQHVDASVWAGEVHAPPFNAFKEGLFRSFDWMGKGAYRLHAKLKAGEIRLHSKTD